MVLDLIHPPEPLFSAPHHDVRRIRDPQYLVEFQNVSEAVWNQNFDELTQFLRYFLEKYPEYMSVYIACHDGLPVSCARATFHPQSQFSLLLGGSTHPDFRNRGFYSALVAARAQEALNRKVRFLCVDALPASQAILEKHGFQVVSYGYRCDIGSADER